MHTTNEENLKQVISLLFTEKVNHTFMLSELASTYPEVFLVIYNGENEPFHSASNVREMRENDRSTIDFLEKENHKLQSRLDLEPDKETVPLPNLSVDTAFNDLPYWAEVAVYALRAGRKIPAVKLVKELTGAGLVQSKRYCDDLQNFFC